MVRNIYKVPSKPSKSPSRGRRKKSTYTSKAGEGTFKFYYLVVLIPFVGIPILILFLILESVFKYVKKFFP